jgi:hypothetical protein
MGVLNSRPGETHVSPPPDSYKPNERVEKIYKNAITGSCGSNIIYAPRQSGKNWITRRVLFNIRHQLCGSKLISIDKSMVYDEKRMEREIGSCLGIKIDCKMNDHLFRKKFLKRIQDLGATIDKRFVLVLDSFQEAMSNRENARTAMLELATLASEEKYFTILVLINDPIEAHIMHTWNRGSKIKLWNIEYDKGGKRSIRWTKKELEVLTEQCEKEIPEYVIATGSPARVEEFAFDDETSEVDLKLVCKYHCYQWEMFYQLGKELLMTK